MKTAIIILFALLTLSANAQKAKNVFEGSWFVTHGSKGVIWEFGPTGKLRTFMFTKQDSTKAAIQKITYTYTANTLSLCGVTWNDAGETKPHCDENPFTISANGRIIKLYYKGQPKTSTDVTTLIKIDPSDYNNEHAYLFYLKKYANMEHLEERSESRKIPFPREVEICIQDEGKPKEKCVQLYIETTDTECKALLTTLREKNKDNAVFLNQLNSTLNSFKNIGDLFIYEKGTEDYYRCVSYYYQNLKELLVEYSK